MATKKNSSSKSKAASADKKVQEQTGGSYVEQSQKRQEAAQKNKTQKAGVFQNNEAYHVDSGNFKALTVEDFNKDLVYYVPDNTGFIRPEPVRPTGNFGKDATRFQDAVLNRRGAYVPVNTKMKAAIAPYEGKVVQARPSEVQKALDAGVDLSTGKVKSSAKVKDAAESGVSSEQGRVADANKEKLAK